MKRTVVALLSIAALAISTPVYASGKPTTTPTPKGSAPAKKVSTVWLLPQTQATPIVVKAGSTVPLKFRLVNPNGSEVKDPGVVSIQLVGPACPTPAPTVTSTLAPVKPSASSKSAAATLRYAGNSFQYQWKINSKANPGCYQFKVTAPIALDGPTIQVVSAS